MSSSTILALLHNTSRCRSASSIQISRTIWSARNSKEVTSIRAFHHSTLRQAKQRIATKNRREAAKDRTEDEVVKDLEVMGALAHQLRFDVWSQPIPTLDLHIPSWRSRRSNASILDHIRAFRATQTNWIRNVVNLYRLAKENVLPGVVVKSPLSPQIFKTQSTPWLAGLRQSALDVYTTLNKAVAMRDEKAVKRYTLADYQDTILARLRSQDKSKTYVWTFHGENKPCKVVSLRGYAAHLGKDEPSFGNRFIIQALVKLDTLQSLQVYDQKGKLLAGDGKPKQVVEYLVFQKRGWVDTPWVIRDQLYETLDSKFEAA